MNSIGKSVVILQSFFCDVQDMQVVFAQVVPSPRCVSRDADCAVRLNVSTLTKLYYKPPAWFIACHKELDADWVAVVAALLAQRGGAPVPLSPSVRFPCVSDPIASSAIQLAQSCGTGYFTRLEGTPCKTKNSM